MKEHLVHNETKLSWPSSWLMPIPHLWLDNVSMEIILVLNTNNEFFRNIKPISQFLPNSYSSSQNNKNKQAFFLITFPEILENLHHELFFRLDISPLFFSHSFSDMISAPSIILIGLISIVVKIMDSWVIINGWVLVLLFTHLRNLNKFTTSLCFHFLTYKMEIIIGLLGGINYVLHTKLLD